MRFRSLLRPRRGLAWHCSTARIGPLPHSQDDVMKMSPRALKLFEPRSMTVFHFPANMGVVSAMSCGIYICQGGGEPLAPRCPLDGRRLALWPADPVMCHGLFFHIRIRLNSWQQKKPTDNTFGATVHLTKLLWNHK